MINNIKAFLSPIIEVVKRIFTPLPKSKLHPIFRIFGFMALAVFPFCCYFTFEFVHFASATRFLSFIENRRPAVLFGIALVYLLFALLLLIFKKGFVASGIVGVATVMISMSNYYKYASVGDYLYPWDIVQQLGNLGELSEFLTIPFPWWATALYIGLGVLFLIILFTKTELPVKLLIRLPLIVIILFSAYNATSTPQKTTLLLNEHTLYLEDMALQTSNYSANGFIGAFTVNTLSAGVTKPEHYSEKSVSDILSLYEDTEADDGFDNPDIILILSESFWDPTLLPNVEFSKDPMANFREIASRDGAVSGKFYTTGLGGGTVRPEFEVLTGLTTDYLPSGSVPYQYIKRDIPSYISVYRDMGYRTLAIHPYTSSFYLRKQGYPFVAINELYFDTEMYQLKDIPLKISGKQISDESFIDYIEYYMGQSDEPTFVFGISMENHQPYPDKFDHFDIEVTSTVIEEGVMNSVKNFTQGIYEADLALKKLVDFIDLREKDTVLVYFGDHLPTLGANYAAYQQSGAITLSGMTAEMNKYLYSTPFLVYANFELNESEMLSVGGDNEIASYNLMNGVATLIGAPRTRYMHFLEDYYHAYPAYNVRLWSINKTPFAEYIEAHKIITYDRTVGEGYSIN